MRMGKEASHLFQKINILASAAALVLGVSGMPAEASPAALASAGAGIQPAAGTLLQLALVVPPPAAARRAAPPDFSLFGTVALKADGLAAGAKWQRVLAEQADSYLSRPCTAGAEHCSGNWTSWRSLLNAAGALSPPDQLGAINRGVNRLIRHTDDAVNYGTSDHWASLAETVRGGRGDCEDYATAKMWLLAALGVPMDRMQLVVLKDKWRQVPHAVLAVHLGGRAYVLDNLMSAVRPADELTHYIPVYSLTPTSSYVHGLRVSPRDLDVQPAARLAPLPKLRPVSVQF